MQVTDLQGFFYHRTFLADVREYRVLPVLSDVETRATRLEDHIGDAPYLCATESTQAASNRQRQWQAWWQANHSRYPKQPARR